MVLKVKRYVASRLGYRNDMLSKCMSNSCLIKYVWISAAKIANNYPGSEN